MLVVRNAENSTFSLPNYRMTIDTFKSVKHWSGCGIFQELQLILLILAQIEANKPQNPVDNTKYNSQFTRIICYGKLLYFPEVIVYANSCGS